MFFLLITGLSCSPSGKSGNTLSSSVQGSVIGLEGTVLINGNPVQVGEKVADGSVLQTDKDGYCEITFMGSNIIKIFDDTIMRISFSEAMVNVERGTAAAVLRNIKTLLKKEDDLFHIESGNVVAGVRGTSFFIKREDNQTTYFCLCNGALDISDPQGRIEIPLRATHHSAIRLREDQDGEISMSRATMEYHTDRDMEELAGKVGLKMDWYRQE